MSGNYPLVSSGYKKFSTGLNLILLSLLFWELCPPCMLHHYYCCEMSCSITIDMFYYCCFTSIL